jgi:hypothetical protein
VKSIEGSESEPKNDCLLEGEFYPLELSVIEEQQSVGSSSMVLKEKFKYLLKCEHETANFTVEQRKIIQLQIKLDEMLDYVRQHRNK